MIRQDDELVGKIISECQLRAAAIQRPDVAENGRLEKLVGDLTRKIDYNRRNPGETEEELKEKRISCGGWERSGMRLKINSP